jgi:hypothetical protein
MRWESIRNSEIEEIEWKMAKSNGMDEGEGMKMTAVTISEALVLRSDFDTTWDR